MSNQSSFIIRRRITNMYMDNGIGMRIILTQINLISPNLQGYSCLRPVAWILSLHVTGSVTRMVLPHLWLLIGTPLVKTLWIWMWIKANLDFDIYFSFEISLDLWFTLLARVGLKKNKQTNQKKKQAQVLSPTRESPPTDTPFWQFCYHSNHTKINFMWRQKWRA